MQSCRCARIERGAHIIALIIALSAVVLLSSCIVAVAEQTSSDAVSGATSVVIADGGINMFSSTVTMLGGLLFCLGIFAVAVRFMKRFSGGRGPTRRRRIEVREKLALSSKASVFLIAVDNREYLIAQGSDSVSVTPTNSITTPLFAESLDEVCAEVGELHA